MKTPLDINLGHLTQFVEGLKALPPTVVDMESVEAPICGTPGCHAGLVSLVSEAIPELGRLYKIAYSVGDHRKRYYYTMWGEALGEFLLGRVLESSSKYLLTSMAGRYGEWWGNTDGISMFSHGQAFGQGSDNFPHQVIVDHWAEVLERTKAIHQKEQERLDESGKALLRRRLTDMANGAGFDDMDSNGDYWCGDTDCIVRLMAAVSVAFRGQMGKHQESGSNQLHTSDLYDNLNKLCDWLWEIGARGEEK